MADDTLTDIHLLPQRILANIRVERDCWVWTGRVSGKGYGRAWNGKRDGWVHRYVYELTKGEIPNGYHIDHLCRNIVCVNPAHLEAVTPAENSRRSTNPEVTRARHKAQTHCKRGHPLFGENLRVRNGLRCCVACSKMHTAAYRAKNREAVLERDRERAKRRYAERKSPDILAEIDRLNSLGRASA